jgi:hypothetical protein
MTAASMWSSSPIDARRATSRKALTHLPGQAFRYGSTPAFGSRTKKALVIDRQIMGSYNFSAATATETEDLNAVTSPEVAATYGEGARDIADNHLAFSIGNSRSPHGADTGWPA